MELPEQEEIQTKDRHKLRGFPKTPAATSRREYICPGRT